MANGKYKRRNRKKKNGNGKPFQTALMKRVNAPMMPQSRLVKLKYFTRFRLDPPDVKAGAAETANNMAIHTFTMNSTFDPDHTLNNITGHSRDGAPNHQPRMYDQWHTFYQYNTVVSAKLVAEFITHDKSVQTDTHDVHGSVTGRVPILRAPEPCLIGFLAKDYNETPAPSVRMDDVVEKNMIQFRKTSNKPGNYKMTRYWSLKKEPLYKTEINLSHSGGSDLDWGAPFGTDVPALNRRYCHIVANALTVKDDVDPLPIDVVVSLEQIVLLSDLKDIAQSS